MFENVDIQFTCSEYLFKIKWEDEKKYIINKINK
ncbi:hypothetical protein PFBG_04152 [Plasmodium falciparum 7G8]|uniref:Uncharacterized protein n=1 Tax=Plasmodium falciparum (isolate 7G8) TaxID=57266 RepID=W7FB02_PLAF8|nr:hypothetical protein PFBG_04152 [Plasmodium falciparum 7G8]